MEEKTIVLDKAEEDTLTVDDLEFKSTKEGIKFLNTLLAEHNELNHIKKKKEKTIMIDENGTIAIPEEVLDYLGIKAGDKVRIESNDNDTITISKP